MLPCTGYILSGATARAQYGLLCAFLCVSFNVCVCASLQEVACEQRRVTPILFLFAKPALTSVWDPTCIKEQHNRAFMGCVTPVSLTLYKSPRTTRQPGKPLAENTMPRCQLAPKQRHKVGTTFRCNKR